MTEEREREIWTEASKLVLVSFGVYQPIGSVSYVLVKNIAAMLAAKAQ